jgi:error-prone DNA polymerase
MINVVVWRDLAERQRRVLVGSQLLQVRGRLERVGEVCHVIAGHLQDMTPLLHGLDVRSRDFR